MSLWKKIKGWAGGGDSEETEEKAPEPKEAPAEAPMAKATVEERFAALIDTKERPDASYAIELLDTMHGRGRSARALELARKILARHERFDVFALRVAEVLSERGDDRGARQLLVDLVEGQAPLPALMLAAEIDERLGEDASALALYERVLAHDLDFPRARVRADRLRAKKGHRSNMAGATIATEGALTRGRYQVEKELGRGGAGTVFAARDLAIERRVALKVYHRRGRVERERLLAEARTPAQIEHPGVVRIFDLDERLGAIAMEWVQGGSVRRELGRGTMPLARVGRWLETTLEALAFVHSRGFIHRDLKPSNFLIRPDDRVVLTDFGLAMPLGGTPRSVGGLGEGTLRYMPPEQRSGAPAEPSADVYAFGVAMLEMLAVADRSVDPLTELAAACNRKAPETRPTVAALQASLSTELAEALSAAD